MIPVRSDVRIWIASGHTDMRRGMFGLTLQVQQGLRRDPHAGDHYIFRGRRGDLVKILWHDGIELSLYAKRLARGSCPWWWCSSRLATGDLRIGLGCDTQPTEITDDRRYDEPAGAGGEDRRL